MNKHDHGKSPGILQQLPVPEQARTHITMDFVEGLPTFEGKDAIMVIVDRFTKYSHFVALTHPFSAESIAKTFIDNVCKLHGMPISIVSDRDRVFTSIF